MRALTLGLGGLTCMVALMAMTATPATSQPRGHTTANRGEVGYRYRQHGYGYRPYYRPYAYYGPYYYYDPYYYPYYYQPYYGPSVSFSFGF